MTDVHSFSLKSKASSRSPMVLILLSSTLISALISLIIGIVGVNRRRQTGLPRSYTGDFVDDQGRVLESYDQAAIHPTIGGISRLDEPVRMQRDVPKTAIGSSEANGLATSLPTDDVRDPGLQGPVGLVKPNPLNRWSLPTKYVVGVWLFLALLFVVYLSRSTLSMIVFAALLAFVAQPLVGFFQRRFKIKHGQSVGLAYLLAVLAMILIPLLIIPAIVQSINDVLSVDWQSIGQDLAFSLQSAAQNVSSTPIIGPAIASILEATVQLWLGVSSLGTPPPIVVDVSAANIGSQLARSLGKVANVLGPLVAAITSLIFMLLISLRMSLSVNEIREAYPKLVPPPYKREVIDLVERIINVWLSFLRGQLSLMVVMGFLTYLLNLLLGTPYPLFLGFLAGLLEIIPNLGPVLATIPAVLLALVFGSNHLPVSNLLFAIIVIFGYILLSGLENQVIVPRVLGDAVNLPPLVVIIGCVVGGATFGLLGVLLATPVISTGKEIIGYLYNKILEPPPKTESLIDKPSMMDKLKGFTHRFRLPFRRRDQKPPPDQSPSGKIEGSMG